MSTPEEINKVRKDIKAYEKNKRMKHLSTVAMIGSTAMAAHGGFKSNPHVIIPSLGISFASGFARGRARREEQAALNRIKKHYDLRNTERSTQEKTAVIGGVIEALSSLPHLLGLTDTASLSHLVDHGMQMVASSPVASTVAAATPMMIDVAGLPLVATMAENSTRNHAYVAAKDTMGKVLSPAEKSTRGFSTLARSGQMRIEGMKPGLLKNTATYFKGLFGPMGTGGRLGENAGQILKEVDKYSPRYSDLMLNAIKDNNGVEALQNVAKKDLKSFAAAGKILDSAIDEVPGLRGAIRATGKSSEGFLKNILNDPRAAVRAAHDIKTTVRRGVTGSKYLLGASALAAVGYGLGNYRKRHALSQNKLPSEITGENS